MHVLIRFGVTHVAILLVSPTQTNHCGEMKTKEVAVVEQTSTFPYKADQIASQYIAISLLGLLVQ